MCFVLRRSTPEQGYCSHSAPKGLCNATFWLNYFSSARSPIFYGLFYPWFQKAMKVIMNCKMRRRRRRRTCKTMKIDCSTMTSFSKLQSIGFYQS
nr:PREDICTED: trace amine-associated receptor 4-like [Phalacrocorax carbo]